LLQGKDVAILIYSVVDEEMVRRERTLDLIPLLRHTSRHLSAAIARRIQLRTTKDMLMYGFSTDNASNVRKTGEMAVSRLEELTESASSVLKGTDVRVLETIALARMNLTCTLCFAADVEAIALLTTDDDMFEDSDDVELDEDDLRETDRALGCVCHCTYDCVEVRRHTCYFILLFFSARVVYQRCHEGSCSHRDSHEVRDRGVAS
jgi:hypothetical protein